MIMHLEVSSRDRSRREHESVSDTEIKGCWSAPGRVNLIGEHTDYNGGLVLPFAIASRTYVSASYRDDSKIVISSADAEAPPLEWNLFDKCPIGLGWGSYVFGMAWLMRVDHARGLSLGIASDVPVGSGLSSSAALEMAVGLALRTLWGTDHTEREIAALGTRAENEVANAPTGTMDQIASMMGQPNMAVFLDCATEETRMVPLDLDASGVELAVVDTGQRHDHASGGYRERRELCERAAQKLGVLLLGEVTFAQLDAELKRLPEDLQPVVRHVVSENQRVRDTELALHLGDMQAVGKLLTESHQSLSHDFMVSTSELDGVAEAALRAGALGARMVGGGFGGSVLALGERGFSAQWKDELQSLPWWLDSSEQAVRKVTPSAGGSRDPS
jgi:galactokinase